MAGLPDHIGPYEVVRVLGHGGQATVYLCRDPRTRRALAVKVLDRADPQLAQRLEREVEVLAQLQHPNIVDVRDTGTFEGRPYFVMRCFVGGTLRSVLERDRTLSVPQAVGVLAAIGDALGSAHADGVVHRDVKPSNVLLDTKGHPYLTDFGVASVAGGEALTRTGDVVGTPGYLAPERWFGAPLGTAADAFALGVMGWEMLTGSLPYTSFDQARTGDHPDLRQLRPDVPEAVAAEVTQLIDPDPANRPSDLRAWAASLRSGVAPASVVPAEFIEMPPDLNPSSETAATIVPTFAEVGQAGVAAVVVPPTSAGTSQQELVSAITAALKRTRLRRRRVAVLVIASASVVSIAAAMLFRAGPNEGIPVSEGSIGPTTVEVSGVTATSVGRRGRTTSSATNPAITDTTRIGGLVTIPPGTIVTLPGGGTATTAHNPPPITSRPTTTTPQTSATTTEPPPPPAVDISVPAASNIYLAGNGAASSQGCVSPPASRIGSSPPGIVVQGGQTLTIIVTGSIDTSNQSQYPVDISNGPDGGTLAGQAPDTNLYDWNGISGIQAPKSGFLVGVFTNGSSAHAVATNPWDPNDIVRRPVIAQQFFVGDGRGSGGTVQQFVVPAGANRLYLGIADGLYGGSRDEHCPSWYGDNTGSFSARITIIS